MRRALLLPILAAARFLQRPGDGSWKSWLNSRRGAVCKAATLAGVTRALDDGLARTPPMGWRTWNAFGGDVTQALMEKQMDALVGTKLDLQGEQVTLADLGFTRVGLDDAWQKCGAGYKGTFHDEDGMPIWDEEKFPDPKAMNDKAHALGLKSEWYHNNCMCLEGEDMPFEYQLKHYKGDVAATVDLGFDGVKLDGCGHYVDTHLYSKLFAETGKDIMIENCHWGFDKPLPNHCNWHFYRASVDISTEDLSWWRNLQALRSFLGDQGSNWGLASQPGCWAYPDMLEVGKLRTVDESRMHFAAWCIVSSPLVLSFDLTDQKQFSEAAAVINKELIAVNQEWAGDAGNIVKEWLPSGEKPVEMERPWSDGSTMQVWSKKQLGGAMAVLLMNVGESAQDASVTLAELGLQGTFKIRCLYMGHDMGNVSDDTPISVNLKPLTSHMFKLTPVDGCGAGAGWKNECLATFAADDPNGLSFIY